MDDQHADSTNKKIDWPYHIKQWESSKLSQPAYCEKAGINYTTFVYWRGRLKEKSPGKQNGFAKAKVLANPGLVNVKHPQSIQIKLISGHIVYVPLELGIDQIAAFIKALGGSHA